MSFKEPAEGSHESPAVPESHVFQAQPQWRFSAAGAFWALVGVVGLFLGEGFIGPLLGLAAIAYSIYLFRGGRFSFIVW